MTTRIRAVLISVAASTLAVVGYVPDAGAKAHSCPRPEVTIEAVITQVDRTDNPGDADYNFFLRPLIPKGARSALGDDIGETPAFPAAMWSGVPERLIPSGGAASPFSFPYNAAATTSFLDTFWDPICVTDGPLLWGGNWLQDRIAGVMPVVSRKYPTTASILGVTVNLTTKPLYEERKATFDKIAKSKSDVTNFSPQCTACVKSLGAELTCKIDLHPQNKLHSCPAFFSCPACVWDLRRLHGDPKLEDAQADELSHYTPKAEIFIADSKTCGFGGCSDDFNYSLGAAMDVLGVHRDANLAVIEGKAETSSVYCKEFRWDGTNWEKTPPAGLCGKHVLVTGRVTYDEMHQGRPEIHPMSRILVAHEKGVYTAGAFIDGSSVGDPLPASYNYRTAEDFGSKNMPATVVLPLQQIAAAMGSKPAPAPFAQDWIARCAVRTGWRQNAKEALDESWRECTDSKIDMAFGGTGGAAWAGEVHAQWQPVGVKFGMTATLQTPQGVIDDKPPTLDASTATLASDAHVKAGPKRGLKRWYLWKVETEAAVDSSTNVDVAWSWETPGMNVSPSPGPKPELGKKQSFSAWLSAPDAYSGKAKANLSLGNSTKTVVHDSRNFSVMAPWVKIKTADVKSTVVPAARGPASMLYTASLSANASGFCGAPKDFKYVWRRNGKLMSGRLLLTDVTSAGPIPVALKLGEEATYDVEVYDPWGVEFAHDTLVIKAPKLVAEVEATCPGGTEAKLHDIQVNKRSVTVHQQLLCKSTVLTAHASYTPAVGAAFSAPSGPCAYTWTELEQKRPGDKYATIPAAWLNPSQGQPATPRSRGRRGRGLPTAVAPTTAAITITPSSTQVEFLFLKTKTTVTDSYGSAPIVAEYEGTNDFSPPEELAKAANTVWTTTIGRHGPVPFDVVALTGRGFTDPNPIDMWFSGFANRVQRTRPGDSRGVAALRAEFALLRDFAIATEMAERVPADYGVGTAAEFTRIATRERAPRVSDKTTQARGRAESLKRLRADPATRDRFGGGRGQAEPATRGRPGSDRGR
jgi:hypothetical protein